MPHLAFWFHWTLGLRGLADANEEKDFAWLNKFLTLIDPGAR